MQRKQNLYPSSSKTEVVIQYPNDTVRHQIFHDTKGYVQCDLRQVIDDGGRLERKAAQIQEYADSHGYQQINVVFGLRRKNLYPVQDEDEGSWPDEEQGKQRRLNIYRSLQIFP